MTSERVNLCKDKFWDSNLTWYTNYPDFTECFQHIILVILPCILFLCAAIVYLGLSWKQIVIFRLPWARLNITKMVLCVILICISALELGITVYRRFTDLDILDIDVYTFACKTVTFVCVLVVLIRNKDTGKRTCTLLVIFWFVMCFCSIILLRSVILRAFYKKFAPLEKYQYLPQLVYCPVLFLEFFLSLFSDKEAAVRIEEKSPFEEAPILSFLTFSWFNSLIFKGKQKLLTLEDLPPLPAKLDARYLWMKFESKWATELIRYYSHNSPYDSGESSSIPAPHLAWTLLKSFWPWILLASCIQLIDCVTIFIAPQILDLLINFMLGKDEMWKGYLYCFVLFAVDFFTRITYNFFMYYSENFATQLQSCLTSAIYRKTMLLSNWSQRKYTTGEIVNLVSVDVEKIYNFTSYCTFAFGSPIKIFLTVVFLWVYLGPSCLSGVAVLVIILGFTTFTAKKLNIFQKQQMEMKDNRLKNTTEVLNGIKVLKLNAWEIPFMKKITDIRNKEVKLSRIYQLFFVVLTFFWGTAPFLVAISCFVTYILSNESHILDPTKVFVSLNLLNILRYALLEVPELATECIQVIVSMRRVALYLSTEEYENTIGDSPDQGDAISIRNVVMNWNKNDEPTLKNIGFHVAKGRLVAVIGPVGSGKSSLLSTILGNMYQNSGSIDLQGQIAYVPQQAWILNQTVKENIIFVKPLSKSKYEDVLESCCLKPDLEVLPAGDDTEIGEKGVNLSGGQKQRVSLARAVYHNADIYLLDDPLSAVDAHVGKHIFEHVIGHNGLLKNKTRILVTHNISVLPEVDFIVTMKDGEIVETGTYAELMDRQGVFSDLMDEFANTNKTSGDIDEPEVEQLLRQRLSINRSISVQSRERTTSVDSKIVHDVDGRLTEDEKMEVGEVKRETFIRYIKFMPLRICLLMVLGYCVFQSLDFGGNVWLSKWSNDPPPVNGTQNYALRNLRIGVYVVFGLTQGAFLAMAGICLALGTTNASKQLHFHMLDSVMKAPMSFFDITPLGRIINRFGKDIEDIDTQIPMYIDGGIVGFFATIGVICLIASSLPLFLPFLIPLGIMYYFIQKYYLIISRQLKRLTATTRSPMYSHLTESIQGVSSINAYKVTEPFFLKLETLLNANCSCMFHWNTCTRWLDFRLEVIADLVILLTSTLAVYSRGRVEASFVGLAILYAMSITDILTWLIRTVTELENRAVSVERVTEYSMLDSEAPWNISPSNLPPSWPSSGKIEFKNYSSRYRERLDLVLKDINLKIEENEKVGIVGRTGAGKSSFALALFRMIEPATGTIDIDNIDVSNIGLHQLRSKLTIIPQDPTLFTGPLRINLDPNDIYSDSDVWLSLQRSNLREYVSSLSEGLNYEIAEGGSNLSVGQRQLVCLARALLKKTKILVLDEATAAVDVETDQLIQHTIRNEFKNHTVITIAHRLNTIMDYDRVLVMDAGRISEMGKPQNLLKDLNSQFYKMARDAGLI